MILTTIEELRLYFPAHAIDHIGPYAGFIDNSEHDFLLQPLGLPLYEKMCAYYDKHLQELSTVDDENATYYNKLILMSQRVVAFDFMGAAIDVQAISINNAGLNYSAADDYKTADRDARKDATAACQREAHKSLNRLLYTLEEWVKAASEREQSNADIDSAEHEQARQNGKLAPSAEDATEDDAELFEIATLWKQSRYYYLAAQMLIPSAKTMQEYLNIYDSREKFIQLLPDLRFIQEELIAPAIGEDFLDYLVAYALRTEIPASSDANGQRSMVRSTSGRSQGENGQSRLFDRLIHRLRKIEATFVEGRTTVLRIDKERKIVARDEAVMLLGRLCEQIRTHQEAILSALGDDAGVFELSPLYIKPEPEKKPCPACCDGIATKEFKNNAPGAAMFVTTPLL